MLRAACCFLLLWLCGAGFAAERLRVIVETDAGGDPDDEQSMVRFLLYSNEWDIEGIIANRLKAREGENRNTERTGLGIVRRLVDAYAQCHTNLIAHDPRYPSPETLRARVVAGHADVSDGVDLILNAVDAADPRPVWFMNWGTDEGSGESNLKRALDKVRKERGSEGYARFKSRIRLSSADKFGDHTWNLEPPFPFWIDTFRPPMNGKRWYHQFSAITAKAGGFDLSRDALTGHGPLGALYPTNTTHWQKEGDTMTFLYLVPTGMNDPDRPGWGSWAGRHGLQPDAGPRRYYWANQLDSWSGSTNRDNTLIRWAVDLQNDFAARLDWCVKPRDQANHRPVAVVNGDNSLDILRVGARPGSRLKLSAEGSTDPDKNALAYDWHVYPEAGSYNGDVEVEGADLVNAEFSIPRAAAGKEIHIILAVRDIGAPPLASYRRVIVQVAANNQKPSQK
ncbi:MAG TPA: nucleoside hydrolase-like domain-containing protein [Methylomirabilota bacterium]|nr:nucleoside hydrolase-like domain-containing protein [Methylomirabilota bacterium]